MQNDQHDMHNRRRIGEMTRFSPNGDFVMMLLAGKSDQVAIFDVCFFLICGHDIKSEMKKSHSSQGTQESTVETEGLENVRRSTFQKTCSSHPDILFSCKERVQCQKAIK